MNQAVPTDVRELALVLWNYHRMGHTPVKADAIVVLCSHDVLVADRGAELFLDGWAPLLVFSGGRGAITSRLWDEPEAEIFARIAISKGVPADRVLVETASTNTGENVRFTRQLLVGRGIDLRSVLLVQKPYMERRAFATFRRLWPEPAVIVTSPQGSFDEYLETSSNEALSPADVISIMVGDLQRIRLYPDRGFQIPQDIPASVSSAYEALVAAGYNRHLVSGVTVRAARSEDVPALTSLSAELGYPVSETDLSDRLRVILGRADQAVLVACDGADVIGWVHGAKHLMLEVEHRCEILGLVVGDGQRRRGVGQELVRAIERWAAARGLRHISVRSNVVRESSHQFYEKQGYRRVKTQHAYRKGLP